jgi:hypothetical protein
MTAPSTPTIKEIMNVAASVQLVPSAVVAGLKSIVAVGVVKLTLNIGFRVPRLPKTRWDRPTCEIHFRVWLKCIGRPLEVNESLTLDRNFRNCGVGG